MADWAVHGHCPLCRHRLRATQGTHAPFVGSSMGGEQSEYVFGPMEERGGCGSPQKPRSKVVSRAYAPLYHPLLLRLADDAERQISLTAS